MREPLRVGFVTAMEREIAPLLRGWKRGLLSWTGERGTARRRLYTREWHQAGGQRLQAAIVISRAGANNAEDACQSLIDKFLPAMVMSVGFAGALRPELAVGDVIVPAEIAREGYAAKLNFPTEFGRGIVVSVNRVVGRKDKLELAKRHAASAVEMEAATVAGVARARGVKFAAVKAISDVLDDEAVALTAPFTHAQGFNMKDFLSHIAVRPRLWPEVAKLKRNSERASLALCRTMRDFLTAPDVFAAQFKTQSLRSED